MMQDLRKSQESAAVHHVERRLWDDLPLASVQAASGCFGELSLD